MAHVDCICGGDDGYYKGHPMPDPEPQVCVTAELQREIRNLRHEVAGWKAMYENEKLLRRLDQEKGES